MPKKTSSKKKTSTKKNRIFHSKETATETALRLYGALDVKDIRKSDWFARYIISEAVKEQRAQIRKTNPTSDFAKMNLRGTTAPQLLSILLAQKSFIKEQEQIRQDIRDANYLYPDAVADMDEFISRVSESDVTPIEYLNENDKWTILRRLATQDPRLNIDRAYASETLREIEDMIEENPYSSISDITDAWLEKHNVEVEINKRWNDNPRFFSTQSVEDAALVANKGFHGVQKAMSKIKISIDNYEPAWETPTPLDPTSIANPQVKEGLEWFNKYKGV